jgi:hypothetical protein
MPPEAVEMAKAIVRAARLDIGGIEYLETPEGRRVFYDINANSNLRPAIAEAFGFNPFDRVLAFLSREVEKARSAAAAPRTARDRQLIDLPPLSSRTMEAGCSYVWRALAFVAQTSPSASRGPPR